MKKYFWNVLISIDQLANTLLGGYPDETISSRCGKRVREGKCYICGPLCAILGKIDAYHCERSIEEDEGKA